jgi:DNA-binding MarR family transcriptional regulator
MVTAVELTVLRALAPAGGRSAEALRRTTPYGVPALVQLLEGLERRGYVTFVGYRAPRAAQAEYVLTDKGMAALAPAPAAGSGSPAPA